MTVYGSKGNDSIERIATSSKVFNYASGDGSDTIYGFGEGDTLRITSGSYSAKAVDGDVIVTVGNGKIIFQEAANKNISIVDSSDKTTTETYSVATSDLFAENNFVTSANLSEITQNNLTPTALEKLSPTNFENLTNENNLICAIINFDYST